MIKHHFYIKKERLNECKHYIRSLNSARFLQNPYLTGNQYCIYVSFENSNDSNAMGILMNKWAEEDAKIPHSIEVKKTLKGYTILFYVVMVFIGVALVFGVLNAIFDIVKI